MTIIPIGSNNEFVFLHLLPFVMISVSLITVDGVRIFQTSGVEKVYDPLQPKTVNPFLAYTPNGTASSVSRQLRSSFLI